MSERPPFAALHADKVRRVRSAAGSLISWYTMPVEASLVLEVIEGFEDQEIALRAEIARLSGANTPGREP